MSIFKRKSKQPVGKPAVRPPLSADQRYRLARNRWIGELEKELARLDDVKNLLDTAEVCTLSTEFSNQVDEQRKEVLARLEEACRTRDLNDAFAVYYGKAKLRHGSWNRGQKVWYLEDGNPANLYCSGYAHCLAWMMVSNDPDEWEEYIDN